MTKKLLTFGDIPGNPRVESIGIYQRLYELDKQKRLEKELERQNTQPTDVGEPVDNSEPENPPSVIKTVSVTDKVSVTETVSVTESVTDGDYVFLDGNWMKFDNDIFLVMSEMSGVEFKVYMFLVSRSYGLFKPQNLCTIGYQEVCLALGIDSRPPISRAMKALSEKGLIKRHFKGETKASLSIYRVFLPSETSWFETLKREQTLLSKR